MGLKVLPEKMLRLMSAADRSPMGKAGRTVPEAEARRVQVAERKLQNDMEALLRQRDYYFIRSRMDRKTTIRKGAPDFHIVLPGGRALLVEVKVKNGRLSDEQRQTVLDIHRQTGLNVWIICTLEGFRDLLNDETK